ncbi:amidohydrolase [Xenorhabdus beddingii]|uniref:Amidohydrolase n=1 Tax=Xenorhabdus beddingii TaxID=40578 RepID=A0A1Y2SRW2_9GAMM|nr:amidohydrolase [Xenorhabdus beddingii]
MENNGSLTLCPSYFKLPLCWLRSLPQSHSASNSMINATQDRVGAMFFLGSGNKAKGIDNYLHANPYFIDDDCLLAGAQIFINLVTH